MYLSVIIPTYNEERRLPKTLEDIDRYLSRQNYDYEIIVVNDGSKDRTAEIVRGLTPVIQNLRLINNRENNGKGYVVRQGMLELKGDFRLFTDADNSTAIDQIEKIWPYFKNHNPSTLSAKGRVPDYEIVIGSRDIKGAILDPPQSWIRKLILGKGFKLLRKIIVGLWNIEDTQCGLKCFTKETTENVFPRCKINRFAFDPEILVVAKKLGYKIKEIPVYWRNDPESKVKFKSMIKMAIDLLKIRWNSITDKYD